MQISFSEFFMKGFQVIELAFSIYQANVAGDNTGNGGDLWKHPTCASSKKTSLDA
jgi:hypothetical protein